MHGVLIALILGGTVMMTMFAAAIASPREASLSHEDGIIES